MASITIGTLTDGGDTITLKYYYSYTQTTSDNASNVSVYIQSTCTANDWPYKLESWSITGTGPTGSGGETSATTGTHTTSTKTKKIFHLSNGAQTFSATIKVTLKYWDGSAWASKSFTKYTGSITLTTINVYSSLSFSPSSPNMQSSVTMTITKPSTTKFTATGVKIVAEYDGTTTTVYEGTGASTSWTVPNLASTTPDSTTKDIAIKIQSIRNSTYYTAQEYTLTVNVPSTVIPSCAIGTITDNYNFSSKIKGYSCLTIPVNSGTAGTGASIVSYSVEVRNDNSSGAIIYQATNATTAATTSFTMTTPIQTTTTYVKVTIMDSRGRTGTASKTVSAVNYSLPQISLTAQRCNSDGTANPKGAYAKVVCIWSITAIGSNNQVQGTINIWKSTNGSTYSSIKSESVATNTYSGTFNVVTAQATNTQGWYFAEIYDALSGRIISSIKIVPKSSIPLTTYDDGTNVGVGVGVEVSGAGMEVGLEATHTQRILTSFKSSVAMGSYQAAANTITNLCNEIRFSSGCVGSANITTALTYNNVTIPAQWYNFMYAPHRSGGVNGSASGDNCNYGTLLLMGMTTNDLIFKIRISGSSPYYNSIQRLKFWNTTRTDTYYLTALTGISRSANYLRLHVPIPSGYTSATATANGDCTVYKTDGTYFQATPDLITVLDVNAASVTLDIKFNGLLTTNTLYCFRNGKIDITLS